MNYAHLFDYIANQHLEESNPHFFESIKSCIHSVFKLTLMERDESRMNELIDSFIPIACHMCHRSPSVQQMAMNIIKEYKGSHSFILWNKTCVKTIFDIYNITKLSTINSIPSLNTVSFKLPDNRQWAFSSSFKDRESISLTVSLLIDDWVTHATTLCPNVFREALENYILGCYKRYSIHLEHGVLKAQALAANLLHKKKSFTAVNRGIYALTIEDSHTSLMKSVASKMSAVTLIDHMHETDSLTQWIETLSKSRKPFSEYALHAGAAILHPSTTSSTRKKVVATLLRVGFKNPQSTQYMIKVLNWIMIVRPKIAAEVFPAIGKYIISVFNQARQFIGKSSPILDLSVDKNMEQERDERKKRFELIDTLRLILSFYADRTLVALKYGNKKILASISTVLSELIKNGDDMLNNIDCFGIRFRIVLLSLIVATEDPQNDSQSFVDKAIKAGWNWFTYQTSAWYDPPSYYTLEEDSLVIVALIKKLDNIQSNESSILTIFLENEIERLYDYHNPLNLKWKLNSIENYLSTSKKGISIPLKNLLLSTWNVSPKLVVNGLGLNFVHNDELQLLVQNQIRQHPEDCRHLAAAAKYLLGDAEKHELFENWAPTTLTTALKLLNEEYVVNDHIRHYALTILRSFRPEQVVFYLQQLVQCLRHDKSNELRNFLLEFCQKSVMFTHQLVWTLRTEMIKEEDLTEEEIKEIQPAEREIAKIVEPFEKDVIDSLTSDHLALYNEEFEFFRKMTDISGRLVQYEKGSVERIRKLHQFLEELRQANAVSDHLYLPTNVRSRIIDFIPTGGHVLKSAKKVPILVPFRVRTTHANDVGDTDVFHPEDKVRTQLCIFKMGDDSRQDQLALQLITVFKRIYEGLDLPLFLFPYRVITTGRGTAIIEVIPHSKSRHDIGSLTEGSLYDYFLSVYGGHENTDAFQKAREQFIQSMAAYSIISYIINIKDRHNGNIMVDRDGHLIHIDFGFLFNTAPGGKFSIEKSAFKLNAEMLRIMGEKPKQPHSESFMLFKELLFRAYLAARTQMDEIINIIEVMIQSQLPCFVKDRCIKDLKHRFQYGKSDREAIQFMEKNVKSAYQSKFTYFYDLYQEKFEKINM
eukprot:CAMPEP_0117422392 /NCGR_PEP_ID=MMETSP0758-20121206/3241_1 /TAXON_ID=63605 /ORGANISM="Percolomonas cosmopolitus, Strain AE-1 (ATCC 50343)" /LENGTH=1098 /DNA_ID=CAMNT_0005204985 /DNA_START=1208 /DNA_END=4504 /DNA_ORIENTATION=-